MTALGQAMKQAWTRLPAGGRVFCAVSGGLDSMTMLEVAARHRLEHDPSRPLIVLHVNHNLRGEESDGDEALVKATAARLQLPIETCRLEWKGREVRATQALCREKREDFFVSLVKTGDRIFLAHHLDDQAETILQRLLRGSGVRGLAGMRFESGLKIRPFLGLSRKQIEEFAREAGLLWREDSSNQSQKYERNWLRLEILPKLEERHPGVARRLAALADEAALLNTLPKNEFSSFVMNEDWAFYRGSEVRGASSARLSENFRLNRLHTQGLSDLLGKGSGRYTAEGVGFRLSNGILLAEKKPFSPNNEFRSSDDAVEVNNPIGHWELDLRSGEKAGPPSALGLGEKAKKEFQRHRVPVFFREMVPLLVSEGRPYALLPGEAPKRARIELGELGRWWLLAKA